MQIKKNIVKTSNKITFVGILTLLILVLIYVVSFADKTMFALLVNPIGENLKIDDVSMGYLMGPIFSTPLAFGVLLAGWCVDRYQPKTIIMIAIIFWSLCAAGSGLSNNFQTLAILRAGVGFGEAFLPPVAFCLLAYTFDRKNLGFATGLYHAGSNLGGFVSMLIGGALIDFLTKNNGFNFPILGHLQPWQATLIIIGLPGILFALFALKLPKIDRQVSKESMEAEREYLIPFIKDNWRLLLTHIGAVMVLGLLAYSIINWSPAYLGRKFSISHKEIGQIIAIGTAAGGLGNIVWGSLADYFAKHGRNDAVYLVYSVTIIIGLPILIFAFTYNNKMVFAVCFALGWFCSSSFGPLLASIVTITPLRLRGRIVALQMFIFSLISSGLAPVIVAHIAQNILGGREYIGQAVAITTTICGILGVILLQFGRKKFIQAVQRLDDDNLKQNSI